MSFDISGIEKIRTVSEWDTVIYKIQKRMNRIGKGQHVKDTNTMMLNIRKMISNYQNHSIGIKTTNDKKSMLIKLSNIEEVIIDAIEMLKTELMLNILYH